MLVLTFRAAGTTYGLPGRAVLEVIPRVTLRPAALAPAAIAGLFTYRGVATAVVDLCLLLGGEPCPDRLGSRIIVAPAGGAGSSRRIGLLAESVTDVESIDGEPQIPMVVPATPFLSGVIVQGTRLIELVDPRRLIPEDLWSILVPEAAGDELPPCGGVEDPC